MRDEGFEFRPIQRQTLDETREFLAGNVFIDEIDLVLVDWQLGGGVEGQQAIAAIRETIQYKDVVFYSGSNDANELRNLEMRDLALAEGANLVRGGAGGSLSGQCAGDDGGRQWCCAS